MKTKHILYLLLVWVAMIACNDPKPVTDALHRAEVLMNEHPDSAWTMLNTLSPDEMGQNSTRALYALLYTQAQDKNYIDETNDSLISIAVDYYRNTDDARHKFLAYYYKGRVLANAKDYLNATTCYMEAEQLTDEVGDDYLVGLLYAELGRIYRLYYDYPKSLEAHQKAAECYERAGKIRHRNYMWLNQSEVYRNMEHYVGSERLLRMALEAGKKETDRDLLESCLGDLVMSCVEQNRMEEAKEFYAELEMLVDEDYASSSFMGSLARIYAAERNYIQANECLEKGWKRAEERMDSVVLYIASSYVYSSQGDGKSAYQELMKGVLLQNNEVHQALRQPVLTAQRDYLSQKLEAEAYLRQMEERLNGVSWFCFVLLSGVFVYVFVRIFKKHKKKSQQTISKLEDAKNKIEEERKLAEEEKGRIASAWKQLDKDKKNADLTIETLKEEISRKEKESNAKISGLLKNLETEKQSVENLQQALEQGEKKHDKERTVNARTIETLNNVIAGKEEDRQKMESLLQKLGNEIRDNEASLDRLREESECMEREYHLYVQKSESEAKVWQDEKRRLFFQKVDLMRHVLENVVSVVVLHEAKYLKEETKEKKIREGIGLLKRNYYAGDDEYKKVETLVNQYLDNVMSHFRKEVSLANESEYRRVCYMFAGVSGQAIGEIMGESKDAVYQRRSRLLKKIASLSCVHKEMYIMLLSK